MSRAFVTLAVGRPGEEMLAVSGPYLRAWAAKLHARFHVIRTAPKRYPLAGKFHLGPIVAAHDRTLFVDVDVIPTVAAIPDVFDEAPEHAVAMHDDLPRLDGRVQWCWDLMDRVSESQDWPALGARPAVWNTGVIVASRRHAPAFYPPAKPMPISHCSEQVYTQLALERAGVPVVALAERWNYQWWFDRSMPSLAERPDVLVRHFAGASQPEFHTTHQDRLRLMRATADEIEGKSPPMPPADRRGRRCLHLLGRTEVRAGCRGWGCRHGCEKGLPAVPGEFCQRCPDFDDDGAF